LRSRGLTLLFLVVLASTLSLKFAKPYQQGTESLRKINGFLSSAGFQVADTEFQTGGIPIIRGRRGDCQIFLLSESSPGWANEMIHRLASADDRVFSVLDGGVYARQPTWRIVTVYRWLKFVRDVTLSPQPTMVLAVIARPACDAEVWDWEALSGSGGRDSRSTGT
jgi:hypothetical protein